MLAHADHVFHRKKRFFAPFFKAKIVLFETFHVKKLLEKIGENISKKRYFAESGA